MYFEKNAVHFDICHTMRLFKTIRLLEWSEYYFALLISCLNSYAVPCIWFLMGIFSGQTGRTGWGLSAKSIPGTNKQRLAQKYPYGTFHRGQSIRLNSFFMQNKAQVYLWYYMWIFLMSGYCKNLEKLENLKQIRKLQKDTRNESRIYLFFTT